MTQPSDENDPGEDLTAFADGELDAARSADVLEYLSTHSEDARKLARAMRFRASVKNAIVADTPAPSAALAARVEGLMAQDVGAAPVRRLPAWRARGQVWFGAAAAALLLLSVGLGSGWIIFGPRNTENDPVSAVLASAVTHIHVDCSRAPSMHTADFPHELGELQDSLKKTLGGVESHPDLSSIGYRYIGAGPCGNPLTGTVHLLYQSNRQPVADTLSLFVTEFHGQVHVGDGKVYWVHGKDSAHPMLVWRNKELVYFLVGDAEKPVIQAADVMHVDAKPGAI